MNKILTSFLLFTLSIIAVAQTPATFKFLGIPVDGKKSDVISSLKSKGFAYDAKNDVLTGKFNGVESNIRISENYGKVDRIYVADANTCNEAQIRIRYNNLLTQFKNNEKYMEIKENIPISEEEDISYEMTVHDKTYDAVFNFNPGYGWTDEDKAKFAEELSKELKAEVDAGKYEDLTEDKALEVLQTKAMQRILDIMEGEVWFRIVDYYGEYYIAIFYDNLKNRPNGEDL